MAYIVVKVKIHIQNKRTKCICILYWVQFSSDITILYIFFFLREHNQNSTSLQLLATWVSMVIYRVILPLPIRLPSLGLFTCSSLQGGLTLSMQVTLSFPLERGDLFGEAASEGWDADWHPGLKSLLQILGPVGAVSLQVLVLVGWNIVVFQIILHEICCNTYFDH